jgi:hypothetical protein
MLNITRAPGSSGDLFDDAPALGRHAAVRLRLAPELKAARALCRRLRHEQAQPDKKRIAHLICLSLLSILKCNAKRLSSAAR